MGPGPWARVLPFVAMRWPWLGKFPGISITLRPLGTHHRGVVGGKMCAEHNVEHLKHAGAVCQVLGYGAQHTTSKIFKKMFLHLFWVQFDKFWAEPGTGPGRATTATTTRNFSRPPGPPPHRAQG